MSLETLELVWPAEPYLSSYVHALEEGWSPDNLRPEAAGEQLARIAEDRARFLTEQIDREAKGPPVILPNGKAVQRLPGYSRWMWDGEFCGSISFRWQPGTADLPAVLPRAHWLFGRRLETQIRIRNPSAEVVSA